MANSQHIAWLLEGVDAWNRRREEEGDDFRPDFIGVNLYGEFEKAGKLGDDGYIPLDGANFQYSNFTNATFEKAEDSAGFVRGSVSLRGANLHMTMLYMAQLGNARLDEADLGNAILEKANLYTASLTAANLFGADLSYSNLDSADLTNADLSNANLINTALYNAKLIGTSLTNARPWMADFYSSPALQSAKQFKKANLDDEIVCNINHIFSAIRDLKHRYTEHQHKWAGFDNTPAYGKVLYYFRGHAKSSWNLEPSVMRVEATKNSESAMLLELIARRPEDFSQTNPALAQWVLAQHHGLPTRFLDVTKNPLVALFHACEQHPNQDGMLHIFAVPPTLVKTFNSGAVSIIANFARLDRNQQTILLGRPEFLSANRNHYLTAMNQLCQLIREEKPHFEDHIDIKELLRVFVVEPQQSSERIRSQSGASLLSAFHERFEQEEILKIHRQEGGPPISQGIPIYAHYTLTVPSDAKRNIMNDLEMLNVTRETLFPGLDSSAVAVKKLYSGSDNDTPVC